MYDYLIVGSGLYGSIFAYEATKRGKSCLVIDKRNHVGGNIYNEKIDDINVHKYGAHIFHTSNDDVWQYVNQFTEFNNFVNSPIARYKDKAYNLPFNMNTFNQLWGTITPEDAKAEIERQKSAGNTSEPKNLEEQAINLVGTDIYEKLIKGYTEKQWGMSCDKLPAFIIKRLPIRFTYDNNYFNDRYQGIPQQGYNAIIDKLLDGIDVELNVNFFDKYSDYKRYADKLVFTGMIDEFYDHIYGKLAYRSLRFDTEVLDVENYQGVAVVNYTEYDIPYTRIIEHKHFNPISSATTVVTKEYPASWSYGTEPYYPINNDENNTLFVKYEALAAKESDIIFGGRLGRYKYYDMDKVIEAVLNDVKLEFDA